MKLSQVLAESNWVKRTAYVQDRLGTACLGYALVLVGGSRWGEEFNDEKFNSDKLKPLLRRMARLIRTQFPKRARQYTIYREPLSETIIFFNDDLSTTWLEISKLVRLWDEEVELGIPPEGLFKDKVEVV